MIDGRAPRVLFADDNEDARELYAYYLRRRGYRVDLAVHGGDALAKVHAGRPDLILLDLSMPVLDGWDLTRMLKTAPETADIPIIVLTAHSHNADRARAVAAGCNAFFVKPLSPRALAFAIAFELTTHLHE